MCSPSIQLNVAAYIGLHVESWCLQSDEHHMYEKSLSTPADDAGMPQKYKLNVQESYLLYS